MAYIGRTPTNAALTAADLADGIVSTVKIAADAVLYKMDSAIKNGQPA